MRDVSRRRTPADEERFGDRGVGETVNEQPENIDLARAQAAGKITAASAFDTTTASGSALPSAQASITAW